MCVCVAIPKDDREPGDEEGVAKLNLSLYGTRDAAINWAEKFMDIMTRCGFMRGIAFPCNFFFEGRQVSDTVHGDDYNARSKEYIRWVW